MRICRIAVLLLLAGCASRPTEPVVARSTPRAELPPPVERRGAITRAELDPVLDAGLGAFLSGIRVEPSVTSGGRFVGHRVLSIYPNDPRFADIELTTGDVVVRINGEPVERPEQVFRIWNGLRVASEVMIEYLRDGERREMRYAIVDA